MGTGKSEFMSVLYSYFFSISFFKIIFVKVCLVFKLCQRELECSKSPPYLPPLRVGKTFGNSWAGTCIAECLQDSETVSYSEQWLWIHILEWHLPKFISDKTKLGSQSKMCTCLLWWTTHLFDNLRLFRKFLLCLLAHNIAAVL